MKAIIPQSYFERFIILPLVSPATDTVTSYHSRYQGIIKEDNLDI